MGTRWPGHPWRGARQARNATVALAAAAMSLPLWGPVASAQPAGPGLLDPPANVPRTPAIEAACQESSGQSCQEAVVEAIDQARAAEGVGPLILPPYYDSLSVPEQLLVLADLERVDRGLPGFSGLSAQLDALASVGASEGTDPTGPPGTDWGSNWAGGEATALLADYDWMYDDGPGSPNVDCPASGGGGCWEHRDNILGNYGPDPSMGAAEAIVNGVTSMTEVFSSAPPGQLDFALPELTAPGGPNSTVTAGYLQSASNGAIFAYGQAGFSGSAVRIHLAQPVVGVQAVPGGSGYWEVAADGGVFSFGHAKFFGSAAPLHLRRRVVGMAPAKGGLGYWLATDNGGVYSFGDAHFYGTPEGHAGSSVIGIVAAPGGEGYWLTTSHGAVYAFGGAHFYGPRRRLHLSAPVVGMAATRNGRGYWLVTAAGAVYSFGDARFYGSAPARLGARVVGIAVPESGPGYYLALSDGRVLAFGGAKLAASHVRGRRPAEVVSIAAA